MNLDASLDFDAVGDVDEKPVIHRRLVKGCVFRGAEAGLLLHEMCFDELAVFL